MLEHLAIEKTTYPVVDFLNWQRSGGLDLNPPYQRRPVWNSRAKSLLIDSVLRGFPLPLIFLHTRLDVGTASTVRQVVDGQQRLRTILSFIDITCLDDIEERDQFTVLRAHNSEFHSKRFEELPEDIRSRILQTPLSVNVLPPDIDDVTVLTIFQRMNSTGLKLNAQELRNGRYYGEFKELSYSLAYEQYQRWLQWKLFDLQKIGQMAEVEFVSDLLGLAVQGVRARTRSVIDKLYRDYDDGVPNAELIAAKFRGAFSQLDEVFGRQSQAPQLKRFRTTGWVYSCFALISRLDYFDPTGKPRNGSVGAEPPRIDGADLTDILRAAEAVLRRDGAIDEGLSRVLRGATSDRASRVRRIEFLRSLA
ncbi:DUF262 domain-containing protein [Kribbella sp. NPDC049584]|uniref:DUF262 domain-containing protein n=1 Tax=Kribbella sp. NPDC049584 TaxID=3154833 RepID=UPI0034422D86